MDERGFKGVWIPKEIWLHEGLSLIEKCLLVEIDSLDCGPRHCYKSNESLAEFLGCSVPTVSRSIRFLVEKKLISVEIVKTPNGSARTIKSLIKMIRAVDQNDQTPTDQNDSQSNTSSTKKESNTKHKHGEFNHVLLTSSELDKLKAQFPNTWEHWIKTLDEGIELKGYRYKSHYLAILKWASRDKGQNSIPLFDPQTELTDLDRRLLAGMKNR